jgi:hypothetical protein
MTGPYQQPGSWGPPPPIMPPPRKSQTGAIIGTVVGVVLMLGLGTWAVIGIISSRHSTEAGGTSTTRTTTSTTRAPRTSATDSIRFSPNDCVWLDVKTSERVSCTSDKAALQINLVIPQKEKCADTDAYDSYGDGWYDGKLALRYCASLMVPKGQCVQLDLDGTGFVERAACTSTAPLASGAPNAKTYQVTDVVSSADAKTACDKVPNTDDVWFYQSPKSGQFACLKRLGG